MNRLEIIKWLYAVLDVMNDDTTPAAQRRAVILKANALIRDLHDAELAERTKPETKGERP